MKRHNEDDGWGRTSTTAPRYLSAGNDPAKDVEAREADIREKDKLRHYGARGIVSTCIAFGHHPMAFLSESWSSAS